MANELAVSGLAAGLTVYAILRNAAGQVWSTVGTPGFAPQVAANIADYDLAMVDTGSTGVYFGDMPAAPAGYLSAEYRVRAGGSPAWTDAVVGVETHQWSGTAWTSGGTSAPTAAQVADAVWDEARAGHVAAGSFGESYQPTGQIASATVSTVTLPAPFHTGLATDREIVIGNQARTLGAHIAGGQYQINRNWDSTPANGSEFLLLGVGELGAGSAPTAAEVADAVWDEPRAEHNTASSFGHGVASVQGNVTGSVASVTGAVASVTGSVGNVAGNVAGSVGSVVGSVGSVTGNVGGSVASVTGNVGGNVVGSVASVTAGVMVSDKTGFKLASDGLDVIPIVPVAGRANTLPKQISQIWGSRFNEAVHDRDAGTITYYANDGTTIILTQSATDTGTVETQGAAS